MCVMCGNRHGGYDEKIWRKQHAGNLDEEEANPSWIRKYGS